MIMAFVIPVACCLALIGILVISMRIRYPSRLFSTKFWEKVNGQQEWDSIKIDSKKRMIEIRWSNGEWTSTRIRLKGSQEIVIGNRSVYIDKPLSSAERMESEWGSLDTLYQWYVEEPPEKHDHIDLDRGEYGLGGDWWKWSE